VPVVDGYAFPEDRWYEPREHLWVQPLAAGDAPVVAVGLDALGQELLGEVVYVELVEPAGEVARGQPLGTLEAEKMVRPVLAPVSGVVLEVNRELLAAPRLVNRDPYGAGWMVRIRATRWTEERDHLLAEAAAVAAWARAELEANRP
jgi:glycine cleavage system H protein